MGEQPSVRADRDTCVGGALRLGEQPAQIGAVDHALDATNAAVVPADEAAKHAFGAEQRHLRIVAPTRP